MKKLIAMAAAILITAGISAFAAEKDPAEISKKKIAYELSFNKIVVDNDLDIQITESRSKIMEVSGTDANIAKVDWRIKNNVLYVKSKDGSLKDKIKINITVSGLKEIIIRGESEVRSTGQLTSPSLNIVIDGDGYASIMNTGSIFVSNGEGTLLDVQKQVGDVVIGDVTTR